MLPVILVRWRTTRGCWTPNYLQDWTIWNSNFGEENGENIWIINMNISAIAVYFRSSRSLRKPPCCAVDCFISHGVRVTGESSSHRRVVGSHEPACPDFRRYWRVKMVTTVLCRRSFDCSTCTCHRRSWISPACCRFSWSGESDF